MCKKPCCGKEVKPEECSEEKIKECHGEKKHPCKDGKCEKKPQ